MTQIEDVNKIIICPLWDLRTIGTEEKKLRLPIQVNDTFLDARALARDEEIDDSLSNKNIQCQRLW